MKLADWSLIALNLFASLIAFMGAADPDPDGAVIVLFVVAIALAVNTVMVLQRSRTREPEESAPLQSAINDEMDVHTVLDFDARLEALERAQHDAVDAARWRALVESGQVTAPASETPAPAASGSNAAIRNGR